MGPAGRQGGGFRLVVDALYSEVTDAGKGVSVPFTFDSKIIEQALRNIRSRKVNTRRQIDPGLFSEVNRIMQQAVTEGYEDPDGDSGFVRQIRNNTEVFAAFKAHRMGRDMASQLLDENGQVKSFQQFRKDTEGIVDHHVNAWLRAEYDTAVKRAHKAEEMRQFMDEADVFPNIEWLPSTAVHRREAHIPFYHHIWPVDDPFWDAHKPGDEWGCSADGLPRTNPSPTTVGWRILTPRPYPRASAATRPRLASSLPMTIRIFPPTAPTAASISPASVTASSTSSPQGKKTATTVPSPVNVSTISPMKTGSAEIGPYMNP